MPQDLTIDNTLSKLQTRAGQLARMEDPKVGPGVPQTFTEGCKPSYECPDCIPQGDLYIDMVDEFQSLTAEVHKTLEARMRENVKDEMELVDFSKLDEKQRESMRQLVPGNNTGAKHCLDSLDGVVLYRPKQFNEDNLKGPVLFVSEPRVITHPTHGNVTLIANRVYSLEYQREYDREAARQQRRARD